MSHFCLSPAAVFLCGSQSSIQDRSYHLLLQSWVLRATLHPRLSLGCSEGVLPAARREKVQGSGVVGVRGLTLQPPGNHAVGWGYLPGTESQAWKMAGGRGRKMRSRAEKEEAKQRLETWEGQEGTGIREGGGSWMLKQGADFSDAVFLLCVLPGFSFISLICTSTFKEPRAPSWCSSLQSQYWIEYSY